MGTKLHRFEIFFGSVRCFYHYSGASIPYHPHWTTVAVDAPPTRLICPVEINSVFAELSPLFQSAALCFCPPRRQLECRCRFFDGVGFLNFDKTSITPGLLRIGFFFSMLLEK